MCNTTYSFTVVAQTLTYTGEVSAAVNSVPLTSLSKLFCSVDFIIDMCLVIIQFHFCSPGMLALL